MGNLLRIPIGIVGDEGGGRCGGCWDFLLVVAEVDPEAAEVFGVFFEAVVLGFDVFLLEEFEDAFFEDAGAFAGDDFDEGDFFVEGFAEDVVEGGVDLGALVEDVVEVEGEFGHEVLRDHMKVGRQLVARHASGHRGCGQKHGTRRLHD